MNRLSPLLLCILTGCLFLTSACEQRPAAEKPVKDTEIISKIRITNAQTDTADIDSMIQFSRTLLDSRSDSLKILLLEAAQNSIAIGYNRGAYRALNNLGYKYSLDGMYDSSLYYLKQGLFYALKSPPNEDGAVANIFISISKLYYQQSQFDVAGYYMYKALLTMERDKTVNYENSYRIYRNIAAFWVNIGMVENALPYFERIESIASMQKDLAVVMDVVSIKAGIFNEKKQFDSALFYYQKILNSPYSHNDSRYEACLNIGSIYLDSKDKNKIQESIRYLNEGLKYTQDFNSQFDLLQILNGLATAYAMLGNYEKAERMLLDVIKKAPKVGLGPSIIPTYRNLAEVYGRKQKYKTAYEQSMKAIDLQDSFFNRERLDAVSKLEVKYRIAQKDKKLALNQLHIAQQQNRIQIQYFWIVGASISSLLLIIFLFISLRVRKHKMEIIRLKATMLGEEKERTRLARELHDGIVSRLSAIKMNFSALPAQHPEMSGAAEDFQKTLVQLEQSIAELRTTSHNLLPEILSQAGLSEAVRIYCIKISNLAKLEIEFMMIGELPYLVHEFQLSVYRIIQELVNNIIKHADSTQAFIQFQALKNTLNITIEDNGQGIPAEQLQSKDGNGGIGLKNLRSRVKGLNGSMEIDCTKGTSIYLSFDIRSFILEAKKQEDE